jgi:hypothetical protein
MCTGRQADMRSSRIEKRDRERERLVPAGLEGREGRREGGRGGDGGSAAFPLFHFVSFHFIIAFKSKIMTSSSAGTII